MHANDRQAEEDVTGAPDAGAARSSHDRSRDDAGILFSRRLLRVGFAWRREIDADLRPFGLTDASWRPILLLGLLGEPVRQGALAKMLEIDGPSLARVIDSLEREGLLARTEDPLDRRTKHVHITTAGMAIHETLHARASAVCQRLLAGVSAADLATCDRVLDSIEQHMLDAPAGADES